MGRRAATAAPRAAAAAASRWHLVDADGQVLGRLSTRIATLLVGKFRPDWAPDRDPGEHVVVVNAARVRLTGRKLEQKVYRRHSGQPGGLKEIAAGDLLRRHPERLIEFAVAGMLPKTRLGSRMIRRLMVYRGPEHPHSSQDPVPAA
ncbi:MAG: 50S ribosomal protein L13 [Acidobacteria bacterium]|nr:50S ribosomal protein L13 [Acidobacteriota bacterium]